ncbi:MAG: hypothetical protein WD627_06285 [Actinomycetota bacterium]
MLALEKTRPTDRYRGGIQFVDKRSNAWAGRLGYLTGLGRSSDQIAEELGDGLHPAFVRTCWGRWGIRPAEIHAVVPLTRLERVTLLWRAEKLGLTPEEWLRQVASVAIRDGLYEAIVGR